MFNLTINAVPASTIIVGRRATWLERHAAEELRDYVKKISGTILNIADETLTMAVTGNRILIGRPSTSDLIKNFADQNPGILPAESDTENDCLPLSSAVRFWCSAVPMTARSITASATCCRPSSMSVFTGTAMCMKQTPI